MKNSPPFDKWDRERCVKLLKIIPQWQKRLGEMEIYQGWKEQIGLIAEDLLSPSLNQNK